MKRVGELVPRLSSCPHSLLVSENTPSLDARRFPQFEQKASLDVTEDPQ